MFHGLHSVAQGTVGFAVAIAELAKRGYVVSVPLIDAQGYDLIADDGKRLLKVQVKSTQGKAPSGKYVVQLKHVHHNHTGNQIRYFDKNSVDILVCVTAENTIYIIPSSDVHAKSTLVLGEKVEQWKVN